MVSETAALHGGHDHATRMDAFAWRGAARVSRHAASQPDDVALRGWPRQCGHEPHDETPACSRGDVGHVSGDGRSDWLPNFKAEPSHGDARHRNAVHSHYARSRRMVSSALWPMRTPAMEKPFQKDLSHLSWDQIYARQALRAELVSAWRA